MNERDYRAAEYVLGTLSPQERAEIRTAAEADPALAAQIDWWERRLAPLAEAVDPVEPPPHLRQSILSRIGTAPTLAANDNTLAALRRRLRYWQGGAIAAGIAAAAFAGLFLAAPDRGGNYIAMVTPDGSTPAMLVSVDTRSNAVQVLPLNIRRPEGKSLEIWYIAEKSAPQSMGVLGEGDTPLSFDAANLPIAERGVFALTVEPEGGSPSGKPTGPVVYSGTLIRQP